MQKTPTGSQNIGGLIKVLKEADKKESELLVDSNKREQPDSMMRSESRE